MTSGVKVAGCGDCGGKCCRTYKVGVTVRDVRVLAEGTAMRPGDFIRLMDTDKDGFRLRPGGPAQKLYLQRSAADTGCVFLLEIAPGQARCGVYAHRPLVCSTFPLSLQRGVVTPRDNVACPPDSWNLAALDLPACRRELTKDDTARAEHKRIVKAWNELVDASGREWPPSELFDYLLNYPPEVVATQDHEA
jgi:Fe-S-cluster containining protein